MERERRNKIGISYDAPESKMVTLYKKMAFSAKKAKNETN
jgi:hypothetical protein